MVKKIPLTRGKFALVDDQDFEWLNQWKWYAKESMGGRFYAARKVQIARINGKQKMKTLGMHRFLMNPPEEKVVDHINGNTLDNRKENLRVVSQHQNLQNRNKAKSSKYPGVYWHKNEKKWRARIQIRGKRKSLGNFNSEKKAAAAYEKAFRSMCGEELICKTKSED